MASAHYPSDVLIVLKKFLAMSKLESMSIGGIGAYILYFKKEKILSFLYRPSILILSILIIPICIMVVPKFIQNGIHIVYSLSSLVIILNVATNPNSFIKLENRLLDYLGKISFGIYMYHMMVVSLVINVVKKHLKFANDLSPSESLVVYLAVISISILLASLSYKLLETPFIKRKVGLSKVLSGENAKES